MPLRYRQRSSHESRRGGQKTNFSLIPSRSFALLSAHAHPPPDLTDSTDNHVLTRNKLAGRGFGQSSLQLSLPSLDLPHPDTLLADEDCCSETQGRKPREDSQVTVAVCPSSTSQRRQLDGCDETSLTLDDLRRRAENEYYETIRMDSVRRRRRDMRTVSKEDCLLGRGANPRTGIVTPGSHSIEHSSGDIGANKTETTSIPAKWRQRGDQWICMDAGQKTPLPTSQFHMQIQPHSASGRLPQSLSQAPARSIVHQVPPAIPGSIQNAVGVSMGQSSTSQSPGAMSGAFPVTPLARQSPSSAIPTSANGTHVRRKPVGSSSSKANFDLGQSRRSQYSPNPATVVGGRKRLPQARSASQPIPRRESPANTLGKISLFHHQLSDSHALDGSPWPSTGSVSFLGPDSEAPMVHKIPPCKSTPKGLLYTDKELPCLPMNAGQSPQLHSTHQSQKGPVLPDYHSTPHGLMPPMHKPLGPRGGNPEYHYHRFQRTFPTPLSHVRNEDGLPRTEAEKNITNIPTYDNPPEEPLMKSTRRRVEGPRVMPLPFQRPTEHLSGREKLLDPSTTISTTTDMFTHDHPSLSLRHSQSGRQPLMSMSQDKQPPGIMTEFRTTAVVAALHTDVEDLTPPVPHMRPRDTTRPPMPTRAAGLHSVPKLQQLSEIQNGILTESRRPSNSTGMQTFQLEESKSTEDKPPRDMQIQPLSKSSLHAQNFAYLGGKAEHTTEPGMQETVTAIKDGLTRRCSRCHDGFVVDKLPNIGGSVDVSSHKELAVNTNISCRVPMGCLTPITELFEQHSSQAISNSNSEGTQEYAIKDQESTCYRTHPSEEEIMKFKKERLQSFSPTQSVPQSEQDSASHPSSPASTTPTSESDILSPCKKVSAKRSKLAFVTRNFRKTLREELTPTVEKYPAFPITPNSFWGGDGAGGNVGAASAAKKAIGLHSPSATDENRLRVARKAMRSRAQRLQEDKPSRYDSLAVPRLRLNSKSPVKVDSLRASSLAESERKSPRGKEETARTHKTDRRHDHLTAKGTNDDNSRKITPLAMLATTPVPKSRNVSGGSIETIRMPQISNMSISILWELLLIPVEASRMWFRNNPQMLSYAWQAAEGAWEMTCLINTTVQRAFGIIYVYSKTGRMRLGKGVTVAEFLGDALRSLLYLILFSMIAIMLSRVLKGLLLPLRLTLLVGRAILGVLCRSVKAVMI